MSEKLTIKLTDKQAEGLREAARSLRVRPSELAETYVEENLRMRRFPLIDFRDSVEGQLAYVWGTGLKVWMTVWTLRRGYNNDVQAMADALECRPGEIAAAVEYAEAYPEEIEPLIADQESMNPQKLRELLPNLVIAETE